MMKSWKKGWNLPFDGERTQFKCGDQRTVKAGQKGGIRSGEARRRKAQRRERLTCAVADLVYCRYLTDVTEDELRDFIAWRGQKKRKKTILAKALEEETEEDCEMVDAFLDVWTCLQLKPRHSKNLLDSVYRTDFFQAMDLCRNWEDKINVFSDAIEFMMGGLVYMDKAEQSGDGH